MLEIDENRSQGNKSLAAASKRAPKREAAKKARGIGADGNSEMN